MFNKIKIASLLAVVLCVSVGCSSEDKGTVASWGSTSVYEDFLWKKHVPDTLTRTIRFDFNEDSKNHMHDSLVIGVFKKGDNGQYVQVKKDEMQLFVNNKQIDGNTIVAYPTTEELKVGVVFSKKAEDKVHHWYLKVISDGGLERINDMGANQFNDASTPLMEISAQKEKVWNPLAKGTTFSFSGLIILVLLWIFILKPILFPVIKVNNASVQGSQISNIFKLKGYRKVIFSSSEKKQGVLDKLFVGKVKYYANEQWTSDIVFEPRDRGSVRVRPGSTFLVDARIMKKTQQYTMENIETKEKCTVIIN